MLSDPSKLVKIISQQWIPQAAAGTTAELPLMQAEGCSRLFHMIPHEDPWFSAPFKKKSRGTESLGGQQNRMIPFSTQKIVGKWFATGFHPRNKINKTEWWVAMLTYVAICCNYSKASFTALALTILQYSQGMGRQCRWVTHPWSLCLLTIISAMVNISIYTCLNISQYIYMCVKLLYRSNPVIASTMNGSIRKFVTMISSNSLMTLLSALTVHCRPVAPLAPAPAAKTLWVAAEFLDPAPKWPVTDPPGRDYLVTIWPLVNTRCRS